MEIDIVWIVSMLAIGSSFLMYLSGGKTCLDFIRKKSTGTVAFFPFVAACVSSTVWLKYGILTDNTPIKIVNTFGCFMQLFYIVVFYNYSRDRANVHRTLFGGAALLYSTLFYVKYLAQSEKLAIYQLGIFGTIIGIGTTSSPLISVIDVIRSKSTETMAFPFIFGCFTACFTWTLYGLLIKDIFLVVPNLIGSIIGLFQLSLFVIYPNERKPLELLPDSATDLSNLVLQK